MTNQLPRHHRDPADRFIFATAKQESLAIVTGDTRFTFYGLEIVA